MCQRNNVRDRPRKDIIAYKVEIFERNRWRTPFELKVLHHDKELTAKGEEDIYYNEIYGGFFHCYQKREKISDYFGEKCRMVKVIIPAKDNVIYKGEFFDKPTICARRIIVTNEIIWVGERIKYLQEIITLEEE